MMTGKRIRTIVAVGFLILLILLLPATAGPVSYAASPAAVSTTHAVIRLSAETGPGGEPATGEAEETEGETSEAGAYTAKTFQEAKDYKSNVLVETITKLFMGLLAYIADGIAEVIGTVIGADIDQMIMQIPGGGVFDTNVQTYIFNFQYGNPYGTLGAIGFVIMRSIALAYLLVRAGFLLVREMTDTGLNIQTGSSRANYKQILIDSFLFMVLLAIMPDLFEISFTVRDEITKTFLSNLGTGDGGSLFGEVSLLGRFHDAAAESLVGILLYLAFCAYQFYLAFQYIFMCVALCLLTIAFPILFILPDVKRRLSNWLRLYLSELITPLIDAIVFLLPIAMIGVRQDVGLAYLFATIAICYLNEKIKQFMRKALMLEGGFGMEGAIGTTRAVGQMMRGIRDLQRSRTAGKDAKQEAENIKLDAAREEADAKAEAREKQESGVLLNRVNQALSPVDGETMPEGNGEPKTHLSDLFGGQKQGGPANGMSQAGKPDAGSTVQDGTDTNQHKEGTSGMTGEPGGTNLQMGTEVPGVENGTANSQENIPVHGSTILSAGAQQASGAGDVPDSMAGNKFHPAGAPMLPEDDGSGHLDLPETVRSTKAFAGEGDPATSHTSGMDRSSGYETELIREGGRPFQAKNLEEAQKETERRAADAEQVAVGLTSAQTQAKAALTETQQMRKAMEAGHKAAEGKLAVEAKDARMRAELAADPMQAKQMKQLAAKKEVDLERLKQEHRSEVAPLLQKEETQQAAVQALGQEIQQARAEKSRMLDMRNDILSQRRQDAQAEGKRFIQDADEALRVRAKEESIAAFTNLSNFREPDRYGALSHAQKAELLRTEAMQKEAVLSRGAGAARVAATAFGVTTGMFYGEDGPINGGIAAGAMTRNLQDSHARRRAEQRLADAGFGDYEAVAIPEGPTENSVRRRARWEQVRQQASDHGDDPEIRLAEPTIAVIRNALDDSGINDDRAREMSRRVSQKIQGIREYGQAHAYDFSQPYDLPGMDLSDGMGEDRDGAEIRRPDWERPRDMDYRPIWEETEIPLDAIRDHMSELDANLKERWFEAVRPFGIHERNRAEGNFAHYLNLFSLWGDEVGISGDGYHYAGGTYETAQSLYEAMKQEDPEHAKERKDQLVEDFLENTDLVFQDPDDIFTLMDGFFRLRG